MFDLSGKIALVTGSGRGVGAGIAEALGRQGAKVVINDYFADRAEARAAALVAEGIDAISTPFDVTNMEAVAEGIQAIEKHWGPVDILINNVGTLPEGMVPVRFLETPEADWHKHLNNNLIGTMNCCRQVIPGMQASNWGRIVIISSDAGRVGNIGSSVYGAAKAGMEALMRTLAKEHGPDGITANSIVLGLIDTVPPEFSEGAEKYFSTRRIGTPKDIGAAAVYLSSEEASWVTGHSLVVNGGFIGV